MSETLSAASAASKAAEAGAAGSGAAKPKLARNLTLFDVYAMSTGAMFSSGLFLLPGFAAAATGNSVWLAYLLAGFLILPAMYCMAELSTAMPKSGGTYYFLDRAMGPMMGTIGGLGSWVAVVFKSAFALVGMGAYLSIYLEVPITITAIVLTAAFGAINIFGAKETTKLQRILVTTLVVILAGFTLLGLVAAGSGPEPLLSYNDNYGPFMKSGVIGLVGTIGLVFVSYAGLTKVASVAEEVQQPDRNIPLGMTLSLLTATVLYALGTFVLVKVLPADALAGNEAAGIEPSYTPIADAGRVFMGDWPLDLGVILIVVAAIAAFASTGNAGIMSASRYPFAMAKDKLMPDGLAALGKYKTPTRAILLTVAAMIAVIAVFPVEDVAKLASAFQLLLFILVSAAVIVMRESRIPTYRPGFKVPLYPWIPILGMLIGFFLILEMGLLAIGFTGMLCLLCVMWYNFYAARRVERRGAIFHAFSELGQNTYDGLEHELLSIINDRTQARNLTYENVVARSVVTDFRFGQYEWDELRGAIAETAHERYGMAEDIAHNILGTDEPKFRSLSDAVRMVTFRDKRLDEPELFIFRFGPRSRILMDLEDAETVHTLMVLLCPPTPAGLDMRLAGHMAEIVQSDGFERRWLSAKTETDLTDVLVRDDHFLHVPLTEIPALADKVGRRIGELDLPDGILIALIERGDKTLIASPNMVLETGDIVALIGEPDAVEALR